MACKKPSVPLELRLEGTMNHFTDNMGIPAIVAAGVILTEVIGPLLLCLGIAVRPVALAIGLMMGAIVMVHGANGFFITGSDNRQAKALNITS